VWCAYGNSSEEPHTNHRDFLTLHTNKRFIFKNKKCFRVCLLHLSYSEYSQPSTRTPYRYNGVSVRSTSTPLVKCEEKKMHISDKHNPRFPHFGHLILHVDARCTRKKYSKNSKRFKDSVSRRVPNLRAWKTTVKKKLGVCSLFRSTVFG
jgi:hypothetical protein